MIDRFKSLHSFQQLGLIGAAVTLALSFLAYFLGIGHFAFTNYTVWLVFWIIGTAKRRQAQKAPFDPNQPV